MIYLQLFYTFFKIGLFGFGGGYAMLSMIQGEVVTRYGWVSSQEFTDIISATTAGRIPLKMRSTIGLSLKLWKNRAIANIIIIEREHT